MLAVNSCQKHSSDLSPEMNSARLEASKSAKTSIDLEDLTVKGNAEARNGILHFKNVDDFIALESKLRAAPSENQKNVLLNAPGFESLSNAIYKAYEPLRDSSKSVTINEVLAANQDILQKSNNGLIPKGSLVHGDVITREGLVYIGKILYRFTGDKEIIVSDGDLAKARQADQPSYKSTNVIVVPSVLGSSVSSRNGRIASTCSYLYGVRWNSDGRRSLIYSAQFQQDTYLASGTAGNPDARYYVSHYTYNVGNPYKNSPAFSYSFTPYNTDNHFFVNYKLHYSSFFTNGANSDFLITSISELANYGNSISYTFPLYSSYNLTATEQYDATNYTTAIFEGGISAFGSNTSQYGYYYSTGCPTPIYMACP